MKYLPLNLNIRDKQCLVVGGGSIALRKSKVLLKAGAKLLVVATEFHAEFSKLSSPEQVELLNCVYHSDLLKDKILVIAATNDIEVNHQVYTDAEKQGVLINVVDNSELCRFIMPSVIDRSPLTIAISSGGTAPVLARMLREKIEWLLPKNIGDFLSKLNSDRKIVVKKIPDISQRRRYWEEFFENLLGWSTSKNISDPSTLELALNYDLEDFNLGEIQQCITLVDLGQSILDELSISVIKLLQKTDRVYLSNKSHQWLKDLIRRDADICLVDDEDIDLEYMTILSLRLANAGEMNRSQILVLKSGHSFETDKKALAEIFGSIKKLNYSRIAAINERCPL